MGTTTQTATRDRFAPRVPDLTPAQARKRLALIKTAQSDPTATWTTDDIMLVANVERQTVLVWPVRGIDFPTHIDNARKPGVAGRAQKIYNAQAVLNWLIRTERLYVGTWMVAIPRLGTLHTPGARKGPLLLPGALARALRSTLGLRKGKDNDFIVRSQVGEDGARRYRLLATGETVAAQIMTNRRKIEAAAAALGHPVRIDRAAEGRVPGRLYPLTVETVQPGEVATPAAA